MNWRWDQGRLEYFSFDEIKRIASALTVFDGKQLPKGGAADTLRTMLASYSSQPFFPHSKNYPVWRNYGRVFGCQMLATAINRIVVCTDLCKAVASGQILADEYLIHVARHFYYSSPVFTGYTAKGPQIFPICAVIKLLVSEFLTKAKPMISIDEIADRIKGNPVDGAEPLTAYATLKSSGAHFTSANDELRQVREMVIFISQLSFLKWQNPNLILDVSLPQEAKAIAAIFQPVKQKRLADPAREVLQLGGNVGAALAPLVTMASQSINPLDQEFTEGNRVRVTHLRAERSSKLKEFYFATVDDPHTCNVCTMDTQLHYPWASRLVELHHLLPLASPIHVGTKATSLNDVVGLCPSCHRATHKYYATWLKNQALNDFRDRSEAKKVYNLAKHAFVP